ncbi:MAG: RdgB/HAM1 family non-canonical purine NTP pyrophosphatase [Ruminococcus sp.]|nr:RdgB/HAM1 family non-canonical purine NTP pyrophosphatase [Ruminococcus sp.]
MKTFVIATNNKKKLNEMARILSPLGINVVTAKDINIDLGDVEENGATFADNAYIKAKSAFDLVDSEYCIVADDSGLCVDALGGKPGIYSARFGGDGLSDSDRVDLLLNEMEDIPADKRGAHFACAICAIMDDGTVITAEGKCHGYIGFEPTGDGGFGYDPIFMVNDKSFSQLSAQEKDECSHRGVALRVFKEKLESFLEGKQC